MGSGGSRFGVPFYGSSKSSTGRIWEVEETNKQTMENGRGCIIPREVELPGIVQPFIPSGNTRLCLGIR